MSKKVIAFLAVCGFAFNVLGPLTVAYVVYHHVNPSSAIVSVERP